ncbi:MAG: DUF736 family protein [Bacteroidales bacterium]|nr:DUF736 family protein [Candidatus Egerieousia equi]MCQ2118153.1 DUF736 domain-containing protein [Bacteroidales bacterium]
MAYEHKEGQGSLFKNEKQNDRQPDYKGTIVIAGKTYEVAAWERTSQRGTSYLSLQASEPRVRGEQGTSYGSGQYRSQGNNAAPAPVPPPPTEEFQSTDDLEDLPF